MAGGGEPVLEIDAPKRRSLQDTSCDLDAIMSAAKIWRLRKLFEVFLLSPSSSTHFSRNNQQSSPLLSAVGAALDGFMH
jgi:hypothetical protein